VLFLEKQIKTRFVV